MESPGDAGGVTDHLAAIRQAVTEWLEYEYPSETGVDESLLRLAMSDDNLFEITRPEMPEILQLIRESRALNIPIYPGSLMDLPYIFHLELATCISAESEFFRIREVNLRALEKWNREHQH